MYQNLLALHSVDNSNQEVISVEDIYEITDSLDKVYFDKQTKKSKTTTQAPDKTVADLQWPPQDEEFVVTLNEGGWALGSSQGYNEEQDAILVQSLVSLKTRVKDDQGRTYWVYPAEEMLDHYEKKMFLK